MTAVRSCPQTIKMKSCLWNSLAAINNGLILNKPFVTVKRKKICEDILTVLWDEGHILGYETTEKTITINFKYMNGQSAIRAIKTISKPGHRIYYSIKQIWKIDHNKNFIVFSTPKGVLSITDCKRLKTGGEPFILVVI